MDRQSKFVLSHTEFMVEFISTINFLFFSQIITKEISDTLGAKLLEKQIWLKFNTFIFMNLLHTVLIMFSQRIKKQEFFSPYIKISYTNIVGHLK